MGRAANNCITSRQGRYPSHHYIKFVNAERPSVPATSENSTDLDVGRRPECKSDEFSEVRMAVFNCPFYFCARSREISGAVIVAARPEC